MSTYYRPCTETTREDYLCDGVGPREASAAGCGAHRCDETDRKTVSTRSGRYIAGVHAILGHRRVTTNRTVDVFVEGLRHGDGPAPRQYT